MKNKYENYLLGLIEIIKQDQELISNINSIKNFFVEKNINDKLVIFDRLEKTSFDIEKLKECFDQLELDLFIQLTILLELILEKDLKFSKKYSEALNISVEKVLVFKKEITEELAKNLDFAPLDWLNRMARGYLNFLEAGYTKQDAYYGFRLLHFLTNNKINKLLCVLAKVFNPIENEYTHISILGSNIDEAINNVKENGYFVFPETLPEEYIDKFSNYANQTRSFPIYSDRRMGDCFGDSNNIFDKYNPLSTRYEYFLPDLLNNPDFMNLLNDLPFIQFSDYFFGSKSFLNLFRLWWTTPIRDDLNRYTGQVFHIDIDKPEALLFITFLTDVNENNGPHIYVKNSHKRKPIELLEDRRMYDFDISDHYDENDVIQITGKKGTTIALNPIGFHKGKPLDTDFRLAMKFEFCNSGFGENIPFIEVNNPNVKKVINELKKYHEYTFSRFILKNS